MSKGKLIFVSFQKDEEKHNAFIPMREFLSSNKDIELLLKKATNLYSNTISMMTTAIEEIKEYRSNHRHLPARKIWELGDLIFKLVAGLNELSLQIDGLYEHLERDLEVKRKWLVKVIIFRRYIQEKNSIPQSLNWGKCEKGTRRKAELIEKGIFHSI